ncbi:MAG TPA: rhodanese-like domain-containing protein [Gemmatimonadales bacterium]|nr:rhodanese-like domain-containing protein [Gemmatimonadales bacterium]
MIATGVVAAVADADPGTATMTRARRRWPWVLLVLAIAAGTTIWWGRPLALRVVTWKTARRFPAVRWIDGDSLQVWMGAELRPRPLILDARTADEFAVSRIPGALRIDPYRPELRTLGDPPRDTAIVVYSSVGYRGARVAVWLDGQGYGRVTDLAGGIFGWANTGRPLIRVDGPTPLVHPFDRRWGRLLSPGHRAEAPSLPDVTAAP